MINQLINLENVKLLFAPDYSGLVRIHAVGIWDVIFSISLMSLLSDNLIPVLGIFDLKFKILC